MTEPPPCTLELAECSAPIGPRPRLRTGHDVYVALKISVLTDRLDLVEAMWNMPNSWPEFMRHDPIGGLYYGNVVTRFRDYVLLAQDDTGEVVSCAYAVPFVREGGALPDNGWDFVIRNGLLASLRGQKPDAISAVEIAVRPDRQGTGSPSRCSRRCATTLRVGASPSSSRRSVPTGRPTSTSRCRRTRSGCARTACRSTHGYECTSGPVAASRRWPPGRWSSPARSRSGASGPHCRSTRTGPVLVPQALAPVHCDVEHGVATYVEPNVWVVHRNQGLSNSTSRATHTLSGK